MFVSELGPFGPRSKDDDDDDFQNKKFKNILRRMGFFREKLYPQCRGYQFFDPLDFKSILSWKILLFFSIFGMSPRIFKGDNPQQVVTVSEKVQYFHVKTTS